MAPVRQHSVTVVAEWLQEKLAAAVKKAEEFNEAAAETDVRKRKYNASAGDNADVTPEEVPPPPHFSTWPPFTVVDDRMR